MGNRRHSAFGILYNPETRQVLLHKRDGNAPVNPNKWGLFGGLQEEGEEPIDTLIRELKEELGITVEPSGATGLCDYVTESEVHRSVFYPPCRLKKGEMRLGEGEDFDRVSIDDALRLYLTTSTRRDLPLFDRSILQPPSAVSGAAVGA